jgi:hypothetical protein
LISGVVSGFFGAGIGALSFMTSYNYLSRIAYNDPKYQDIDFRAKNMVIYMCSDLVASTFKLPFEARK